jgi:hypothetical protein
LTSFSFDRIRFEIVMRLSQNCPFRFFAQMCVKPKKSNVSGFPRPRFFRRSAAYRPTGVWRDFRVIPGRWHRAGKVFPLRVR